MTQADLARILGKSQAHISRRLNGSVAFTIDEIDVIAAAFGVPLTALLAEPAA